MPYHDWPRDIAKAFGELAAEVERIAQMTAGTEADLFSRGASEEETARDRLEYEFSYESQGWDEILRLVDERKAKIDPLLTRRPGQRADG